MCPSLVCLDVKLYSFLNSAACICNAQQLQQVHDLGEVARDRFRNAVIGEFMSSATFISADGAPCLINVPFLGSCRMNAAFLLSSPLLGLLHPAVLQNKTLLLHFFLIFFVFFSSPSAPFCSISVGTDI